MDVEGIGRAIWTDHRLEPLTNPYGEFDGGEYACCCGIMYASPNHQRALLLITGHFFRAWAGQWLALGHETLPTGDVLKSPASAQRVSNFDTEPVEGKLVKARPYTGPTLDW